METRNIKTAKITFISSKKKHVYLSEKDGSGCRCHSDNCFAMENIVYIVLIIIWLAVSFLKKKPDQNKQAPQKSPKDVAEPATSSTEKELDMEDMLEEFFGGGKKKKEREQTIPQKEERVFGEADKPRPEYQEYSREQRSTVDRPEAAPVFEQAPVQEQTPVKTQTIDELIQSHKREEALRLAQEEQEREDIEGLEGVPEFDLRDAVIFSEILKRKY